MPKDPAKNVDRYKIRGGVINEYEYHENQQALAQNELPGDKAATKVSKPQEGTKSATTKKAAKKVTSNTMRGASAKKLAARKAARK